MDDLERPVRHGMLTKRSISKSKTTFNARFQERWFVLTDKTLSYHTPNGTTEKGRISVNCIRCCEPVMEETFNRQRMFQVVYSDKGKLRVLYLQSDSRQYYDEWLHSIRLVTERACREKMLKHYHEGAFIKKKWSCCRKTEKEYTSGCTNTYIYNRSPDFERRSMLLNSAPTSTSSAGSGGSAPAAAAHSTIKRKISLQQIKDTFRGSSEGSPLAEEEISEAELSDEDLMIKSSLDSTGNSPFTISSLHS